MTMLMPLAKPIDRSAYDIMVKRGIARAAKDAGWHTVGYRGAVGMAYPIFDPITGIKLKHKDGKIVERWTALDPANKEIAGGKYKWLPSKPHGKEADWYVLPGTVKAIADANGQCYLANGEKSVLAFWSAGIKNVVATTHTETKVPDVAMLWAMGVRELVNIPDNDEAGYKGAILWEAPLQLQGISYVIKRWGTDVPKFDANDLWIDVGFSADKFLSSVVGTSTATPPPPTPQASNNIQKESPTRLLLQDNMLDAILQALETKNVGFSRNQKPQKSGYTPNHQCIFHDDDTPSAGINPLTGVYHCFVCGTKSPRAVAEQLGIEIINRDTHRRPKKALNLNEVPKSAMKLNESRKNSEKTVFDALSELFAVYQEEFVNYGWWGGCMPRVMHNALDYLHAGDGLLFRLCEQVLPHIDSQRFKPRELAKVMGRDVRTVKSLLRRYDGIFFEASEKVNTDVVPSSKDNKINTIADLDLLNTGTTSMLNLPDDPNATRYYRILPTQLSSFTRRFIRLIELRVNSRHHVKSGVMESSILMADEIASDMADWEVRRLDLTLDDIYALRVVRRKLSIWRAIIRYQNEALPEIEGWESMTIDEYTKAYLKAIIGETETLGWTASYEQIGDLIGIEPESAGRLMNQLDLCKQQNEAQLRLTARNKEAITEEIKQLSQKAGGFPKSWSVLRILPNENILVRNYKYSAISSMHMLEWLENEDIEYGVAVNFQCANTYWLPDFAPKDAIKVLKDAQDANHVEDARIENIVKIDESGQEMAGKAKRKNMQKPMGIMEREIRRLEGENKRSKAKIWIPEIDEGREDLIHYSGHFLAIQFARNCGMTIRKDLKMVSAYDENIVIFDKVTKKVLDFIGAHLSDGGANIEAYFPTGLSASQGKLPTYHYPVDPETGDVSIGELREQIYYQQSIG
jgi:hypothetical protein